MARVTVEDCLARVPNRFALTVLASRRARAISEGRGRALVDCENKEGVTALREISADRVRYKEVVADTVTEFIEQQRRQLRVTTGEHTFLEAASLRALEDDDEDEDGVDEPDVEELQTDPEKLNKQAQGDSASDDDDDADAETTSESADSPAADADDLDTEALGDDVDDTDDTDDSDDGDDAKES